MARFSSPRWRIAIKVLTIVVGLIVLKLIVHGLHWDVLSLNPLFSGIIAANFFLLGFLLAGTLTTLRRVSV